MFEAVVWSFAGEEVFCLTVLRREPIGVSWSVQLKNRRSGMLTLETGNETGLMRESDCVLICDWDGMQQRQWTTADNKTLKVMRRLSCQGERSGLYGRKRLKHSRNGASMQQRNI